MWTQRGQRIRAFAFTALAVMLSASSVNAQAQATQGKPTQTQAVQGILTGENGEQIKFSIPAGRELTVKDKKRDVTYRLVPERLSRGEAQLKVIDVATNRGVDRFELEVDGKPQSGTGVPFSLALTGITTKQTADRCQQKSAPVGSVDGPGTEADCCVGCGDWIVCCEPSPGWCCGLECVGGDSCSACTAMQ